MMITILLAYYTKKTSKSMEESLLDTERIRENPGELQGMILSSSPLFIKWYSLLFLSQRWTVASS